MISSHGPYALTPNTVELISTLGAFFPRGGPRIQPRVKSLRLSYTGFYPHLGTQPRRTRSRHSGVDEEDGAMAPTSSQGGLVLAFLDQVLMGSGFDEPASG